jgi:FAD synthetase
MRPTVVVAQGVFDLLHPGHLHYLRESARMGDELNVIIGRGDSVSHKEPPILPDEQRRRMVAGLDPVDDAIVGHPEDMFQPLFEIEPDIITLGYDQGHSPSDLEAELEERGLSCSVRRVERYQPRQQQMWLSSSSIVEEILTQRTPDAIH